LKELILPEINIERRIKRHIWPKTWDMFAVCAPGLEDLLAQELNTLDLENVEPFPGGVGFSGNLNDSYLVNLWSRLAGRVLLRLKDFRVRRFSDLTRQMESIPWEAFLSPGAKVKFQVTLKDSTLGPPSMIAEESLRYICRRMRQMGLSEPELTHKDEPGRQMIMVRGIDRRATISLDTSGDHLHKRGYRLASGKAPLREDLAAALLAFSGYKGKAPLADPMCGSGTLGIEAALAAKNQAPGLMRGLAMEHWPAHREPTWQHLKNQAEKEIRPLGEKAPIFSTDRLAGAINLARQNADRAKVEQEINLYKANFFTLKPPTPEPGLVSVREAKDFAAKTASRLLRTWSGWRVGVVLYRPEWSGFFKLKHTEYLVVPHGGVKITLLSGQVP
jgi:putative N6-adenine-specific DNA methylase